MSKQKQPRSYDQQIKKQQSAAEKQAKSTELRVTDKVETPVTTTYHLKSGKITVHTHEERRTNVLQKALRGRSKLVHSITSANHKHLHGH